MGQLRSLSGLAPTWLDPAETSGIATPFMVLYGLHDAMLKPRPGNPPAPALAEAWTTSPDGLAYEFVLRRGFRFHNGEPVTAEDVEFSFERHRGAALKPEAMLHRLQQLMHEKARFAPIWQLGATGGFGPSP